MTTTTLQGMKPQSLVAERDFTFGMEPKEEPKPTMRVPEKEKAVEVHTRLLPVRRFYRLFEAPGKLTTNVATTSFRNHRGVLAAESHVLQDSRNHH